MNLLVLMKRVPATQEEELRIVGDGAEVDLSRVPFKVNDWDTYAIEEAVKTVELTGGAVTAISMGDAESDEVLRRSIAMGAKDGFLIETERVIHDPVSRAGLICNFLKKESLPYDAIFTGVQSEGELAYEEARREGVLFIHLEEGEDVVFEGGAATIRGPGRELALAVDRIIRFDDYMDAFKGKDFLSVYRSEPQLRWSPTKWGRKKYHVGFIRHPRAERWEARELLGALGEIRLDEEEERVFPEVDEDRCSGCASCKNACPHSAIEMEFRETAIALFGPAAVPIAHIKEDTRVGCGLCVSTCPSDVITYAP
jgi:NAD-dependent dihydropyrimidine dehydrogenase PreA subunit